MSEVVGWDEDETSSAVRNAGDMSTATRDAMTRATRASFSGGMGRYKLSTLWLRKLGIVVEHHTHADSTWRAAIPLRQWGGNRLLPIG